MSDEVGQAIQPGCFIRRPGRASAHHFWRASAAGWLVALLVISGLSACAPVPDQTTTLGTVFPATGPDAAVGQAMQRGVDLAVKQNASLGNGYTLAVTHVDGNSDFVASAVAALIADPRVMGIVGPMDSQNAVSMLPTVEQNGIATISPTASLPGLTQADQAAAEGVTFTQLHPNGKAIAFFRLTETDNAAGKAAANLAVAPASAHGLGANAVFVVDDGSTSGKALAAAFVQQLKAKHGSVAGQQSMLVGAPVNVPSSAQSVVTAIIEASPDLVFYAGDIPGGAELRGTLSLTGAPQLPILTAGPVADDPAWSTTVGVAAASTATTALLPAQDLSTLPKTKTFVAAYQSAFPGKDLLPQSALAYDAAMDEIAAIKSLIAAGKTVSRATVLAAVANAQYAGVTGTIAFDTNGDVVTPTGFSIYTCDVKGTWQYQASLSG
jgi:branched-chain amino acid transport system substrate-binding protein